MVREQIPIDEKYTFQIEDGHVQILRGGEPWVGEERGGFVASKAWISAAYQLQDLREELAKSKAELKIVSDGGSVRVEPTREEVEDAIYGEAGYAEHISVNGAVDRIIALYGEAPSSASAGRSVTRQELAAAVSAYSSSISFMSRFRDLQEERAVTEALTEALKSLNIAVES